ncbi:LOW QUALITY PROTEIN: hypothetical protein ACHAW6_003422 [Cyclotella cf. meneghiniana]
MKLILFIKTGIVAMLAFNSSMVTFVQATQLIMAKIAASSLTLGIGNLAQQMSKLMHTPIWGRFSHHHTLHCIDFTVIVFSVSYKTGSTNQCTTQCSIGTSVPLWLINREAWGRKSSSPLEGLEWDKVGLVTKTTAGTNVFEKKNSSLPVFIVKNQNFDGVNIDYEYCFHVNDIQSGSCKQRTSLYSDEKAQTFFDILHSKLRVNLDALQLSNGCNHGCYELTHAPMDMDISSPNSNNDLDFIIPQFYNGVIRPGVDDVDGTSA